MANILIVGPGYVGGLLAEELVARGEQVWAMKRSPGGLPPGATPILGNVADANTCAQIPGDMDVVVYSAAPSSGEEANYREVYVDGLRTLLSQLCNRPHRPERLLLTASTGVYHQKDGSWVDEESPTLPTRYTGKSILEGEALLAASPLQTVSLRLAGIYGPERTRLIRSVASQDAICVQGQPHYTNRIHRRDCAGALMHLIDLENPQPIYVGVDNDPVERFEMLSWVAEQIQVPPPRKVAPEDAPPRLRGANKRCRNHRLVDSGYKFKYPGYRDGYGAILEDWPPTT